MAFREIAFGSDEYELACSLREEILRAPLGLSLWDEDIDQERNQLHFGLFQPDGELVACVVVIPLSHTEAKIRQMAVSRSYQRKGLGLRMMNELEANLRARGFTRFALHARASAVGFYEKLGYSVVGDEFTEVTLPHRKMEKTI